jgi:hypothetical protein
MDDNLYDEFGNYIGPELVDEEELGHQVGGRSGRAALVPD